MVFHVDGSFVRLLNVGIINFHHITQCYWISDSHVFDWRVLCSVMCRCGVWYKSTFRKNLLTLSSRSKSFFMLVCLLLVGWDWVYLVLWPLLAYCTSPRWHDGDCGAIGGMKFGRGNRSTRRKPAPVPLCPPQIPYDQNRPRIRAAAVGSQRLTAFFAGCLTCCWTLKMQTERYYQLKTRFYQASRNNLPKYSCL
jgi:hypothetical protein